MLNYLLPCSSFWLILKQHWTIEEMSILSNYTDDLYRLCKLGIFWKKTPFKSSPRKSLSQIKANLAGMVLGWSPFNIVSDCPALHSRWLIILKGDHLRIISANFGWNWLSSFRAEDFFWKRLRSTTDGRWRRTPSDGNSSHDPLGQVS
jgi:hypothetical protein